MGTASTVRVLHLEDDPLDAELVSRLVAQKCPEVELVRVDGRDAFKVALERERFDLVLSDYSMPGFDGLTALGQAKGKWPEMPFIFVSGQIGEDRAIEALRHGATDYVLKDRLSRLPAAIRRALDEVREREKRREAERALGESHRLRDLVLGSLPLVLYSASVSEGLETTWISENVATIAGVRERQFFEDRTFWASRLHPDDRDRTLSAFQSIEDLGTVDCKYRWKVGDGSFRWFHDHALLVRDPESGRKSILGFRMDVTESKRLEEQFMQAQRMEAVGRLAGGVAHDFNNLLTAINGYSELLLSQLPGDSPFKGTLKEIHTAGTRARGLTGQLLAFSRRQVVHPRVVNLNEILSGVLRMLERLVGKHIRLLFAPREGLWGTLADPGQLEQVIVNLVVNARDAMPQGGTVTIEAANVELDGAAARAIQGGRAGPHVLLTVSDTGTGMSEEVKGRLFEPYFTTKEIGKGTGLGLATVHGIVRQSEGFIAVTSEPGRGTTFRIYFPKVRAKAEGETGDESEAAPSSGGTETILLVEDTETVRRLAQVVLESAGYRVLAARDGLDALQKCENPQERIDLLLTDVAMAGMTGPELAGKFRQRRPEARVVLMSGYLDREMKDLENLQPAFLFLPKPFTLESLRAVVRKALDSPKC